MLRKISILSVFVIFALFMVFSSCDMMDRDSKSPVGVDEQETDDAENNDEEYLPEKRDFEGPYPLPLLPDPPGIGEAVDVCLTLDEFKNITSEDNPYSDVPEKEQESPQQVYASWYYINSRIYIRAYADNGRYVGLNCKDWVRRVVKDATGKDVPSTSYGGWGWYWNWSPYVGAWRGTCAGKSRRR